jgi:hypothetical protein
LAFWLFGFLAFWLFGFLAFWLGNCLVTVLATFSKKYFGHSAHKTSGLEVAQEHKTH